MGRIGSHKLRKPKYAQLTNPYASEQHLLRVAVQSNEAYAPPLASRTFAGIAARQMNVIR
jgi:hypothetical protein